MNPRNLDDLSALWQSQTPAMKLDIEALQQRYRKQRWLMRFNFCSELLILLVITGATVWSFFSETQLQVFVQSWMVLFTLWGWGLFIPLNISRWRSFNLMQSKSLTESVQDHIRLVDQEIRRWRLSRYSTGLLIIVLVVLGGVRLLAEPFSGLDLIVDVMVIGGLLGVVRWFSRRQKACQKARKILSN